MRTAPVLFKGREEDAFTNPSIDAAIDSSDALGVMQSAIGRSISKYEKAIGLQLLRRDARPLTLTQEDLLVVAHAAEID